MKLIFFASNEAFDNFNLQRKKNVYDKHGTNLKC